jgi:chromosome segregation ATPase
MSILARIARRLGVVRLSSHQSVLEQLRRLESQNARLARELDTTRAASRSWKDKSDAASRNLKAAVSEVHRLTRKYQKAADENARLRQSVEPLAERVVAAEDDLTVARQNLMAVEVKLDILEGAAQVLDRRTRFHVPRESDTPSSA